MKETSDAINQPLKTYIRLAGSKQPVNKGTIGEVSANGDEWRIYRDDISDVEFTDVSLNSLQMITRLLITIFL